MIKVELSFQTEAELVAFFSQRATAAAPAAEAPKPPKAAKATPAPSQPTAEVVEAAAPAPKVEPSEPPAPAPAPEAAAPAPKTAERVPEYSEVAGAITGYLGAAPPADADDETRSTYAARRAAMVRLLASYQVKKGTELRPDQYALFILEVGDLPK